MTYPTNQEEQSPTSSLPNRDFTHFMTHEAKGHLKEGGCPGDLYKCRGQGCWRCDGKGLF